MLGGMFGQLNNMMAESSRQAAGAKEQALAMIQDNQQVVRLPLHLMLLILKGLCVIVSMYSVTARLEILIIMDLVAFPIF